MDFHPDSPRIAILGMGKVGQALLHALYPVTSVRQVYNRSPLPPRFLDAYPGLALTHQLSALEPELDLILICVKDDAIAGLAAELPTTGALVVHSSGTVPSSVLSRFPHRGVFYPLQTFSPGEEADLSLVPFCLFASSPQGLSLLTRLCTYIGSPHYTIDDAGRERLHLAAVIINNFSNHLIAIARQYMEEEKLDFDILKPLLTKTLEKALTEDARLLQTGPARRHDLHTMNRHLALLRHHPQWQKIYTEMSRSIHLMYGL